MIEENSKRYIFEITEVETVNEKLKDIEYYRIMIDEDDYSNYNVFRIGSQFIGVLPPSKNQDDMFFTAIPGTKIYATPNEDIIDIFDIGEKADRIRIGSLLRQNSVPVNMNFQDLFMTHASILGRTGSGKTYFIKNLLEKLKAKYIVISPTDEYNHLAKDTNLYDSGRIPINIDLQNCKKVLNLNNTEFTYLDRYCEINKLKKILPSKNLADSIHSFYQGSASGKKRQPFLFDDVILSKKNEVPRYVESLCDKLSSVNMEINMEIDTHKKLPFDTFPAVLNTQELSEKDENIAVYMVLSTILNSRKKEFRASEKKPVDILIILEEAHNYAPSIKTTLCKDIIIQIARVGRKYGLHLLVLSQRPRNIDPTLLSQCGTNIIFNLPNPQDIEYIMEQSFFYNEKNKYVIQSLKVGECLITSNVRNTDIVCKISP
jgi:DNA helicase HerA-like ATPase